MPDAGIMWALEHIRLSQPAQPGPQTQITFPSCETKEPKEVCSSGLSFGLAAGRYVQSARQIYQVVMAEPERCGIRHTGICFEGPGLVTCNSFWRGAPGLVPYNYLAVQDDALLGQRVPDHAVKDRVVAHFAVLIARAAEVVHRVPDAVHLDAVAYVGYRVGLAHTQSGCRDHLCCIRILLCRLPEQCAN